MRFSHRKRQHINNSNLSVRRTGAQNSLNLHNRILTFAPFQYLSSRSSAPLVDSCAAVPHDVGLSIPGTSGSSWGVTCQIKPPVRSPHIAPAYPGHQKGQPHVSRQSLGRSSEGTRFKTSAFSRLRLLRVCSVCVSVESSQKMCHATGLPFVWQLVSLWLPVWSVAVCWIGQ